MFGDEPGVEVAPELRSQAFTHKKLWQRFAIVAAGPLMNLIISFLIFTLISVLGEEQRLPVLGDILQGTKAYSLGFRSGDKVVSVDAQPVTTWDQMQNLMTVGQGHAVRFAVLRANDKIQIDISAIPELAPNPNPISTDDLIGAVDGLTNNSRAAVVGVLPGSVAEKLGLKTGDRILTVNGKEVNYFRELENVMITAQNQQVQIKVDRYTPTAKDDETAVSIVNLSGHLGEVPGLASLGLEASDLHLAKVIDGSPAAKAGIKADDKITKINGVVPMVWEDVLNTVKSYSGTGAIKVEILRQGKTEQFEITPSLSSISSSQGLEEKRYTIGIMPWIQNAVPPLGIIRADSAADALHRGVYRTKEVTGMIVVSFLRLFQAKISPKNIGGVIVQKRNWAFFAADGRSVDQLVYHQSFADSSFGRWSSFVLCH